MPSLNDLRRASDREGTLVRLAALGRSQQLAKKLERSRRIVHDWLGRTERPMIACGGGKDSVATALIVREMAPEVPIYRADPPNPLPDRPDYVRQLQQAMGGSWRIVDYWWDVEAVLDGRARYPELLKLRRLKEAQESDGVDGIALGIRAAESRGRRMNRRVRGVLYEAGGYQVATPVADWTAEEILGFILASNRAPLNPVYRKTRNAPDFEFLRDGTWYPREVSDAHGYRTWLLTHYGDELVAQYDLALLRQRESQAR
jgi:3'-phosphoadenosine 5'-phosphosulfate sulfotransferase (PAPS reductase)/FAD synthetase